MHVFADAEVAQDLRRLVLMQQALVVFPDEDVILSHTQQNRDILRRNDMALAKHRPFLFILDDLCDVVTEDMAYGVFGFHQLHGSFSLPFMI